MTLLQGAHDVVRLYYLPSGEQHDYTFGHIKVHIPLLAQLIKLIDVARQCEVIGWGLNLMVHETVVCEQAHGGIDCSGDIINVK